MLCSKQPETVSIIIPVYHVEEYIEECIQSVILQSYPHLEIILVDDCGQDKSCHLAEELLKQSSCKWSCVHHDTNRGLSAARNTGVDAATGDYIYFLDSDDYIAPDTIQRLLDAVHQYKTDVAIGCGITLLMPDRSLEDIWQDTSEELHKVPPLTAYLRRLHNFAAWHRLINRKAYLQAGVSFREGIQHEDIIWSLDMAMSGLSVCSAQGRNLYYYRQREGSIMAQPKITASRINGFIESTRAHYQVMIHNNLTQNEDFGQMYSYLFNETIHMIMADRSRSMRSRSRDIAAYLHEFKTCVPAMKANYRRMNMFVSLARVLPAAIAYKLATYLTPKP